MTPLVRVTQQSYKNLEKIAEDPEILQQRLLSTCVPTCFYMLGRQTGYLQDSYESFIDSLDWSHHSEHGWIRPHLSKDLRTQYGMDIVSWQINGNITIDDAAIERMVNAGYLSNQREITFFKDQIVGKTPKQVVQSGFPIIVGMQPGFGENKQRHGVLITEWTDEKVTVIDPDERNPNSEYAPDYIEGFINPLGGGCTVVLPKEA